MSGFSKGQLLPKGQEDGCDGTAWGQASEVSRASLGQQLEAAPSPETQPSSW